MKNNIIKVCGLKHPTTIQNITTTESDWLGFIFYEKSPRYVNEKLYPIIHNITGKIKVGVFVNESEKKIREIMQKCDLQMVQLHGDELPQLCENLSKEYKIIKAISIKTKEDLLQVSDYDAVVDYFLFDTKKSGQYGGTGEKFNWRLLRDYKGKTPFLLSGGIQISDLEHLHQFEHELCVGYDINSGFEITPGEKNVDLVTAFIQKIKNI